LGAHGVDSRELLLNGVAAREARASEGTGRAVRRGLQAIYGGLYIRPSTLPKGSALEAVIHP